MKEVLPGIFQITLTLSGFKPGSVNIYLLRDDHECTLVDTGWDTPESVGSLHEQLDAIGIYPSDIRKVICTHCHIDHFGLAELYQKGHGAIVYMHRKEIRLMKIRFSNGDQFVPMTDKFLQAHNVPQSELTPPEIHIPEVRHILEPDVLLEGGEEFMAAGFKLKVINTPGHTPGHISLYEPGRKFLFSGDVLLPTIDTNAAFHISVFPNPLRQYLDSLERIRELDVDLVLPGHEHVFGGHRQRIEEIVNHHETKNREILSVLAAKNGQTAYEISRALAWSPRKAVSKWTTMTGWDKRFALLQTIAHLEEMTSHGQVRDAPDPGGHRYFLVAQ